MPYGANIVALDSMMPCTNNGVLDGLYLHEYITSAAGFTHTVSLQTWTMGIDTYLNYFRHVTLDTWTHSCSYETLTKDIRTYARDELGVTCMRKGNGPSSAWSIGIRYKSKRKTVSKHKITAQKIDCYFRLNGLKLQQIFE